MSFAIFAQAPTGGGIALGATLTSGTPASAMVSEPVEGGALPPAPMGVVIRGFINVTSGATAGAYSIKCYQGVGTGGTQIGLAAGDTFQTIASSPSQVQYSFTDTNVQKAPNGVYTIVITAAGSNGVFNDGAIEVYVPMQGSES
jgi:hypothetical protein